MSELKTINAYQLTTNTEDSDVYIHNDEFGCGGDLVECYLKSEADKVIAHHKYKRCLDMASIEWLKKLILCKYPYSILFRKTVKRERKWKELAEKFKEAK